MDAPDGIPPGDVPHAAAAPDFNNLLAVLRREKPKRPTLFEFFLNDPLYDRLAGDAAVADGDLRPHLTVIEAFQRAGYDYASFLVPGFEFPQGDFHKEASRSLNEGALIHDRTSFEAYPWPDPHTADYAILDRLAPHLPKGMKLIAFAPDGVLEIAMSLVGFENLCYLTVDDQDLAGDIFEAVGSRLVEFYRLCAAHDSVGAILSNDDWGFKSQTMLSPGAMRRLVFPWHKKIVETAHAVGKPAILHSCGCLNEVMDDIIEDMRYDGKHSYEDVIQPVESAYDQYHKRIAILGGIDLDFLCRSTPEAVYQRSREMLARTERDGAYALGTGNSVPEYVPDENFFAMIRAALDSRDP